MARGVFLASGKTFRCRAWTPQSWWGSALARGVFLVSGRIFRCRAQTPQSWQGSAVARGVFLVSGRICRARIPSRGGAQRWPAGSSVPGRRHLQHVGSHLDPRAAQLLRSTWDSCSPAQDRICVPCVARQALNRWTTREVSLLYF